ncbi:hypothetical protein QTI66_27940 [Variovorax sp. J22R133]|uniref:hypothetical protein n=1 Tax=Variovorax brevis TaxID=3053503 RepID=UPI002576A490|nr:hypothetical protein [Variovorax sp. J22R133]MDM0116009.1 hypothetical protein [Variovorax sp. J22R133]
MKPATLHDLRALEGWIAGTKLCQPEDLSPSNIPHDAHRDIRVTQSAEDPDLLSSTIGKVATDDASVEVDANNRHQSVGSDGNNVRKRLEMTHFHIPSQVSANMVID